MNITVDRDCPFCESNKNKNVDFLLNRESAEPSKIITTKIKPEIVSQLHLSQCLDCGVVYWSRAVSEEGLVSLYSDSYRSANEMGCEQRLRTSHSKAFLFYKNIEKFVKPNDKLLDLGCAEGFLVDYAKKKGLETHGLDLNLMSVHIAQYNRLSVHVGDIDALSDKNKFDIVFTSGYFEHVPSPIKTIKLISDRLKVGGYLYIGTPNLEQPNQSELPAFFPPEHLQTFSKAHLVSFMGKYGFESVASGDDNLNIGMYVIFKKTGRCIDRQPESIFDIDKFYQDWIAKDDRFIFQKNDKYAKEGIFSPTKYCYSMELFKLCGLVDKNVLVDLYYALKDKIG